MSKLGESMKGKYQDEFNNLQNRVVPADTVNEYVQNSLSSGQQPLPILNRITERTGELLLLNYKLNTSNAGPFASSLKSLVPATLKKIFLLDNLLKDRDVSNIFESLAGCENGGITSFALV